MSFSKRKKKIAWPSNSLLYCGLFRSEENYSRFRSFTKDSISDSLWPKKAQSRTVFLGGLSAFVGTEKTRPKPTVLFFTNISAVCYELARLTPVNASIHQLEPKKGEEELFFLRDRELFSFDILCIYSSARSRAACPTRWKNIIFYSPLERLLGGAADLQIEVSWQFVYAVSYCCAPAEC